MVCSLKNYVIPYGAVEIGAEGQLTAIKEKPHLSFFVNTGVYIVELQVLEDMEPNTAADFPDVMQKYVNNGNNVGVFPVSENAWMDMGQFDGLNNMIERFTGNP